MVLIQTRANFFYVDQLINLDKTSELRLSNDK